MIRSILTIVIVFIISSCESPAKISESDKAAIRGEVQRTLKSYFDDIRVSGLTAEFNYLDSSKDFFWVPPGYSNPISFDSVRAILLRNAINYKYIDNSFEALTIVPLSKDLATYSGQIRSNMTEVSGDKKTFSLVETGVLIKRADGWKLLSGQTSVIQE